MASLPDNIRTTKSIRDGLSWLYGTDLHQLAAEIRSGPPNGQRKLLMAVTLSLQPPDSPFIPEQKEDKTVIEEAEPDPAPSNRGNNKKDTSTGAGRTDASNASQDEPSGSASGPPIRQVQEPTFLDPAGSSDARCPISTRQVVCCRASCITHGCIALCGYSSEVPNDGHFINSSTVHKCKECYRDAMARKKEGASSNASTDTFHSSWSSDDWGCDDWDDSHWGQDWWWRYRGGH